MMRFIQPSPCPKQAAPSVPPGGYAIRVYRFGPPSARERSVPDDGVRGAACQGAFRSSHRLIRTCRSILAALQIAGTMLIIVAFLIGLGILLEIVASG